MLIRFLLTFILLIASLGANAQPRIRIFYGHKPESVLIRIPDSTYYLRVNADMICRLEPGDMLLVSRAGDRVAVKVRNQAGFLTDSMALISTSGNGYLDLSLNESKGDRHEYQGNFTFSSSLGELKIINTLAMDDYIAGVVQAEGGYKGHPEYFKSQAVIARTYAFLHLGKHADEGYDLCDDVHCQVYHGRSLTEAIDNAVRATKDQVLVDGDSVLILTPFHSNCGGETVSSGDVWLSAKPYLASVYDPYCAFSRNASWERDIDRADWLKYISDKAKQNIDPATDLSFTQNSRISMYRLGETEIPLKVIRSDWGFRSTFFSIKDKGSTLYFTGRGYGHGVGLCQEGAMVMATRGFSYKQILNFYYNKVYLINIKDALKEEGVDLSF